MTGTDGRPTREDGDWALLKAACQGDIQAFEALCLRLEPLLYNYLLRLVKDCSEAEDLAQETLLRLYRTAQDGQLHLQKGSPRALTFSIAHNLAMDYHRRARNAASLEAPAVASAAAKAENALLRDQIDKAIADLPESHRSALMLREFGELTYAEIADTLGATQAAVKTWIYRARHRLAELLDRDGQYIGERDNGV